MNVIKEEKEHIIQTYKRYPVVLTRGKGASVWDDKGKRYLDFFAGLSVCNIGHCHPAVVAAVCDQSRKLIHVSNLYYTEPSVALAKTLVRRTFPGKVFFSNSGAEANECAIKLARKWGKERSGNRYGIITFKESFHGRTMATLSATGQEKFHKGFEPMLEGFSYAVFNDLASVKKLITKRTAAIMVEPVQGEGGVNIATRDFLAGLKSLCKRHGLLLIFDEIQSGLGRTGDLFAFQTFGVTPDILTSAKSLGGGLPLGATIARRDVADVFTYGAHGSTFGGNPVACAAGNAVMDVITPALLSSVRKTGAYFLGRLEELKTRYGFIKEVRGIGFLAAAELEFPGREIVERCMRRGLLINCTQDTVLRFLPPLLVTKKDVDTAIGILDKVCKEISRARQNKR